MWIRRPQVAPSSQGNGTGDGEETDVSTELFSSSQSLPMLSPLTCVYFSPKFLIFFILQSAPHFRFFLQSYPMHASFFSLHINGLTPVTPLPLPQAFFNDKYIQEHPEDLEKIEKLKDFIAWQVSFNGIMLICVYV